MTTRIVAIVVGVLLLFAPRTQAQDVYVMTSGAFTEAFLAAAPDFERAAKTNISTAFGASMGGAPDSIPSRLNRGEPADVVRSEEHTSELQSPT